jgi:hypothetical protein
VTRGGAAAAVGPAVVGGVPAGVVAAGGRSRRTVGNGVPGVAGIEVRGGRRRTRAGGAVRAGGALRAGGARWTVGGLA